MDDYKEELTAKKSSNNDLNLLNLLESRIIEIIQVEKEVKKKFPKLFYQRLPRFMRRRAASHNPKRIPKFRRPHKIETKDRKKLLAHRRKVRFLKNKRILKKNKLHVYKDKNKSVLHKWFAKRFMIERTQPGFEQVPLYNNTKNQRNLYRQTRYGCCYLSLAHLVAVKVESAYCGTTLDELNRLTESISGFTFSARALESDRYEAVVHLYAPKSERPAKKKFKTQTSDQREYICPCYVTNLKTHLIIWVQRTHVDKLIEHYQNCTPLMFTKIQPCDWVRLRLLGPNARDEALKIVEDKSKHLEAIADVDRRLMPSYQFGVTLGRRVNDTNANFTYYQTDPLAVDIVFRNKAGRMLWHQLIKNKSHLVGGKRDVDILLTDQQFSPKPDNLGEDEM